MSGTYVDAGSLDERLEILALREEPAGTFSWQVLRRSWAKAELSSKRSVFSARAVGAPGVTFTLRRQDLSPANAIAWRGQHCLLTFLCPLGRTHMTVDAALVEIVLCRAKGAAELTLGELNRPQLTHSGDLTFPAVVAERYVRSGEGEPYDTMERSLVLTVPKAVPLLPEGRLVTIDGNAAGTYEIRAGHPLDRWVTEYEVLRREDL